MPSFPMDALGGAVAGLRDADDLAQAADDEAEANSRCCRFGGEPAAPTRRARAASRSRWRASPRGANCSTRQPGEADQLASGAHFQGEHPEALHPIGAR